MFDVSNMTAVCLYVQYSFVYPIGEFEEYTILFSDSGNLH